MAPGGQIHQDREEVALYLDDMETVADAMAANKYWDRPQVRLSIPWIHFHVLHPQFAILKEMYVDLQKMHYSFRNNR